MTEREFQKALTKILGVNADRVTDVTMYVEANRPTQIVIGMFITEPERRRIIRLLELVDFGGRPS